MRLRELIAALPEAHLKGDDADITAIVHDSRKVAEGALFVCLKGLHTDGHNFVADALQRGATAVVAEREVPTNGKPLVLVPDSWRALALLCHRFYGEPTKTLTLIGVTGTNGKTTTTHLIAHLLNTAFGEVAATVGTVGLKWREEWHELEQTTPDAPELVRRLAWLRDGGARFIVMEVSSHALAQKRSDGCLFDAAVFTNLSHDHLDFHGDMENYFAAKARLFTDYAHAALASGKTFHAFINADDPYGQRLIAMTPAPVTTYGFADDTDYRAVDLCLSASGTQFTVVVRAAPNAPHPVRMRLLGRFNVANALAAIAVARHFGVAWDAITDALPRFAPPAGRLELVDEGQPFTVAVDYAHTPDALEKVLRTVREVAKGRVIVVFGCGGDRDPHKRPVMGRIATQLADHAIITSDNPRTEDPLKIIEQIVAGVADGARYHVQPDRRQAIFDAIQMARAGDFVLIAGKGHETYQIVGTDKHHFDDREVAREALRQLGKGAMSRCHSAPVRRSLHK
ncbi:UDP-N-acetylmuramoyl-L-alanyl-D-glutamate--2, 6-diaminopimelate ligase [bacterium HR17]|uniref:UDP-N-acetylmuramoyl-L-alanyl-D-glutamate--2,6-diaminopimelate ligase n=1 Tax=Candidatus Fervidibacter japonicus TaxID=2035412 RepID=A0A2H5XER5_9BACT|nr:UDP-N-acetylmuramoyl-L-alanyl-D-glutamate--2, 6-diaminopimelate ligase [bacterium HR17]